MKGRLLPQTDFTNVGIAHPHMSIAGSIQIFCPNSGPTVYLSKHQQFPTAITATHFISSMQPCPPQKIESAIKDLIVTFNELNSSTIEELDSEPSPLEFMRYVSRNSPFVIRGAASSWKATRKWNSTYLTSALAGQAVNVAVTPHGFVGNLFSSWPIFLPHHLSVMDLISFKPIPRL
jgi:jumonji domain-containing protein 7